MTKSAYSENEVAVLLNNLVLEKKRAQDLEMELERVNASSPLYPADDMESVDQTQKFKQLIGVLRKKYEEAQHKNNESQKKIELLLLEQDQQKTAYASLLEELHKKEEVVQELHKELQVKELKLLDHEQQFKDSEEELIALRNQLAFLKEMLQEASLKDQQLKEELEATKQKQSQLERVIQFLRQRAEEAQLENHELSKEFQASQALAKELQIEMDEADLREKTLQEQLDEQLNSVEKYKEQETAFQYQVNELNDKLAKWQDRLLIQEKEKQILESSLKEQKELMTASKEEFELIKQTMERALQQAKEEQIKHEEAHLKKIEEFEKTIIDNRLATEQIIEEWRGKLLVSSKEAELVKQAFVKKQDDVENLKNETEHLAKAQADLEEKLASAGNERDESESRLKVAQQHLAKKVREATLLSEKNEEYRLQQLELQNTVETSKAKLIELQSNLEMEANHQKRLQDQYQESLKTFEAQALKWEEKYFFMHERWQDSEIKLRDLRRQEDHYLKLQNVLNQLASFMGPSLSLVTHTQESLEYPEKGNQGFSDKATLSFIEKNELL